MLEGLALKASIAGIQQGIADGSVMFANAMTLGRNDTLNDYVNDAIERNGGAYYAANISARVGAAATYAVGALLAVEYAAANGLYTISSHAAKRMIERNVWNYHIAAAIAYGSRRFPYERGQGVLQNAANFASKAVHVVTETRNGTNGTLVIVRNLWDNNIITTRWQRGSFNRTW